MEEKLKKQAEYYDILPQRKEYCLLVKGAFSHAFCDKIISDKKHSFKKASSHYPTSYRNNERQIWDSENLSTQLFQKIKDYIPKEIDIEGISKQEHGTWYLDSLNSRIRICRYLPNQYFNKHLDGVHFASAIKQSKLTFMIYLNGSEDFLGGRTLFFNSKQDETIIGSYNAEKGDLIIFDHNLWHSGERLIKGEKYILRSDLIYRKSAIEKQIENTFCGEGHLGYIWTASVCNTRLITSGRDKKIKIWSKQGEKVAELIGHESSILSLIVFDHDTLITGARDMSVNIWKRQANDQFQLKNSIKYHEGAVLSLCQMNNKEFLTAGADGVLNRIDLDGNLVAKIQAHHEWIWGIEKIDETTFATISEDGFIKIWNFEKGISAYERTNWKGNLPINSIVRQGALFYMGRLDGSIVKLKLEKEGLRELETKKCHQGIIRRLVIDGDYLYSASEDNTMKVWNVENLDFIKTYAHKNFVQDIVIFDDAVITVSYDGEIRKNEKI